MKRQFPGLSDAVADGHEAMPDGVFLVRVEHAQYRLQATKPFYVLRFSILEPKPFVGKPIVSRLYCTPKAIWKLGWFLRDFLYDQEQLIRDEIDERALRGLMGVVKISHTVVNGISLVNLDGFAPASKWEELSAGTPFSPVAKAGGAGKRRVS
jgi:hypothetical protein